MCLFQAVVSLVGQVKPCTHGVQGGDLRTGTEIETQVGGIHEDSTSRTTCGEDKISGMKMQIPGFVIHARVLVVITRWDIMIDMSLTIYGILMINGDIVGILADFGVEAEDVPKVVIIQASPVAMRERSMEILATAA